MPESLSKSPDPKRFEVSPVTLWFDRIMGWVIRFGGIAVILAVFGIFYFIIKEVVPLFRSADVGPAGQVQVSLPPAVLGVDEWGTMPFVYDGAGKVLFVNFKDGARRELEVPGLDGAKITAFSYDVVHQRIALGLEDGRVGSFLVDYKRDFEASSEQPVIEPKLVAEPWFELTTGQGPVRLLSYGDAEESRVVVVARGDKENASVAVLKLGMKRSLIGKGKLSLLSETDITSQVSGRPIILRASQNGAMVLLVSEKGEVDYFLASSDGVSKRQTFRPFENEVPHQLDFLFGGVSVVLTSPSGMQEQWSLYRLNEEAERLFGQSKEFPKLPEGEPVFASSTRKRAFATGTEGYLSLRYSTSGAIRWEKKIDFTPVAAVIDGKNEHLLVATQDGEVRRYSVYDHHPEAGWRAYFGKVWYEGGSGPIYHWQSNGGTDDYEPKLSQIPLIFGSLKGTAYALLFSVPVALLAAVFSAAFLPLSVKRVVKPVMEIMSSVPSVVLGFLAGLWLAPILENRVPSVVLMVILIPLGVLLVGALWCRLPIGIRNRVENGHEWLLVMPVLALTAWLGWILGPVLESALFIYKDAATGKEIADFRLWWPQVTGTSFEQRNCMVLGFIMGFAVIPVIFTIAEDALSNVPKSLTSAAAALGANRWQVVWTVMLPVASSGIFSALMIGFGRAVGETMIMVMATGNTPLTEWNLFNGMRTLAANIAVELPEAPVGSTHYRTLFLGAVVLFFMTSIMNTIAELLRQRLRERHKIV